MDDENELPIIETPKTGLSEKQQENVIQTYSKFLESRLEANADQRMTAELRTGMYHCFVNQLDSLTKSVIAGSTPAIPGIEIEEREQPLTDDEVDELIIKPFRSGEQEQ